MMNRRLRLPRVTVAACVAFLFALSMTGDRARAGIIGTDAILNDSELIGINTTTGVGSSIGLVGFENIAGLAFDPNANRVYGSSIIGGPFAGTPNQSFLVGIDLGTGAGTLIGEIGFDRVGGLAFDPNSNTLYGVDGDSDQLITINTTTGMGTAVGALGFGTVTGLAFDPLNDVLYGVNFFPTAELITIDTTTEAGTAVDQIGTYSGLSGLAFDTETGTPYGSNISLFNPNTIELLVIEPTTGKGESVGFTGFHNVNAITAVPNQQAVPEPSSLLLMLVGFAMFTVFRVQPA